MAGPALLAGGRPGSLGAFGPVNRSIASVGERLGATASRLGAQNPEQAAAALENEVELWANESFWSRYFCRAASRSQEGTGDAKNLFGSLPVHPKPSPARLGRESTGLMDLCNSPWSTFWVRRRDQLRFFVSDPIAEVFRAGDDGHGNKRNHSESIWSPLWFDDARRWLWSC